MRIKLKQIDKGFLRLILVLSVLVGVTRTFIFFPELRSELVTNEVLAEAKESFKEPALKEEEINLFDKWIMEGDKLDKIQKGWEEYLEKLKKEYTRTRSYRSKAIKLLISCFSIGFLMVWTIFLIIRFIIVPVALFVIKGFKPDI